MCKWQAWDHEWERLQVHTQIRQQSKVFLRSTHGPCEKPLEQGAMSTLSISLLVRSYRALFSPLQLENQRQNAVSGQYCVGGALLEWCAVYRA
jgi:hypothetical protein